MAGFWALMGITNARKEEEKNQKSQSKTEKKQ